MEEEYINQLLLYPQVMRKTGFAIDWDNLKIITGRGFDLRGSSSPWVCPRTLPHGVAKSRLVFKGAKLLIYFVIN